MFRRLELITEILSFLQIFSLWENQPLSFFNISENLQENLPKTMFRAYFWALKANYR